MVREQIDDALGADLLAIGREIEHLFPVLPEVPQHVWHRFSFDVVQLSDGVKVAHIRFAPIERPIVNLPPPATPTLRAYDEAMKVYGVPHEPLQVYDSNSWRRVGLVREYKEVMAPTVARDGHPDIRGTDVLVALVAAFNAMLELRKESQS